MKKKINTILVCCFFVFLLGVPMITLCSNDQSFSENENKYLAQKPKFSVEHVLSGAFMEDMSQYLSDQIAFRQFWITLKTKTLKLLGSQEINGVYIGKDDYLIEKWLPQDVDVEQFNQNIEAIDQFAKRHHQPTHVMIVPTAGYIMSDKLPKYAPYVQQEVLLNQIKQSLVDASFVDVSSILLAHAHENLYYHSDHHWTTYGAFLGYQAFKASRNEEVDINDYDIQTVSKNFKGSMYSKVLDDQKMMDTIEIYSRHDDLNVDVSYNFGKESRDSVYNLDRLKEKDQYQVFLNGNYPEISITTHQKNGKHLLIFKDSYANAFIPFLVSDYESIHVIDCRYFKQDIESYLDEKNITEIMFLYNIKSFAEETNLNLLY